MKKFIAIFAVALMAICEFASASIPVKSLNSAQMIHRTLQGLSHCLHYRVTGLCSWWVCSGVSCHPETTLKLDHYLPDAVITVYNNANDNPWFFARQVVDPVMNQMGHTLFQKTFSTKPQGGQSHSNSLLDLNNHFHEVDIIGNPAVALLQQASPLLLPSAATPYQPYYSSLLDRSAWRFPGLERFYLGSHVPGLHDVGIIGLHDWGPVYPRNGFINQPNDAKAAAVIALRASTIVTASSTQPHLYYRLTNHCGPHCSATTVKENNHDSQYQLIFPIPETYCVIFGKNDLLSPTPWEQRATLKGKRRYAWVLWRRYRGCVPLAGATYLSSVSW